MFRKIEQKELITILGWVVTCAIGWGTMTTRLSAQEDKIKELSPLREQIASLSAKLEYTDKRNARTERMVQDIWSYLLPREHPRYPLPSNDR